MFHGVKSPCCQQAGTGSSSAQFVEGGFHALGQSQSSGLQLPALRVLSSDVVSPGSTSDCKSRQCSAPAFAIPDAPPQTSGLPGLAPDRRAAVAVLTHTALPPAPPVPPPRAAPRLLPLCVSGTFTTARHLADSRSTKCTTAFASAPACRCRSTGMGSPSHRHPSDRQSMPRARSTSTTDAPGSFCVPAHAAGGAHGRPCHPRTMPVRSPTRQHAPECFAIGRQQPPHLCIPWHRNVSHRFVAAAAVVQLREYLLRRSPPPPSRRLEDPSSAATGALQ